MTINFVIIKKRKDNGMKKNFAETLKELRIRAGYSQKEVYEMLHIRQSTFSAWETGRAEPSADILLKLCRLYHVSDIFSAFGYDSEYRGVKSAGLNMQETEMVEKYRALDTHGREMVDFTLRKEWERSQPEAENREIPPAVTKGIPDHLKPRAAHNDHASEPGEQEKMQEDLASLTIPDSYLQSLSSGKEGSK